MPAAGSPPTRIGPHRAARADRGPSPASRGRDAARRTACRRARSGLKRSTMHGAHLGRHAAARNPGTPILRERELDAPGEHVRAVARRRSARVSRLADPEGVQRARIRPGPELAVDLRVAEDPRACRSSPRRRTSSSRARPTARRHAWCRCRRADAACASAIISVLSTTGHFARSSTVRMSVGEKAEPIEAAAVERRCSRRETAPAPRAWRSGWRAARRALAQSRRRRPVVLRSRRVRVALVRRQGLQPLGTSRCRSICRHACLR